MAAKRLTAPLATFTLVYRFGNAAYTTSIVAHDAAAARARFQRDNPNCHILSIT